MDVKSGPLWSSPSTPPWPPLLLAFPHYPHFVQWTSHMCICTRGRHVGGQVHPERLDADADPKWDPDRMWRTPPSAWRETFSQTRQIPKLREGDCSSILGLFIFLCPTPSWGLSALTFTSWRHSVTEWLLAEGEIVSGVPVEINLNATVVLFICPVMAF